MRNIISIYPFFILISISAQTQKETVTTTSELDTLLHISFNAFAEEAACWTPEQKQEFADVFFIERGKFTIPKEPIILKSFERH